MAVPAAGPASRTPRALTIAGSDSGGGAGIQADLKAFAYCGVYGMSAVTAITAQNTVGVEAVMPVPPEIVLAQVRAVVGDIGVDAVKVGMLGSREVTLAVATALDELPAGTPVVVDPVMVAESGAALLAQDAVAALIAEIVPRASVLTPNLPEAAALVGRPVPAASQLTAASEPTAAWPPTEESHVAADARECRPAGEAGSSAAADEALLLEVLALGCKAVVLTGGHRSVAVDLFLEAGGSVGDVVKIEGPRHPDGAAHGSGCTHSSVLAAQLALGHAPLQAAIAAREIAGEAVARGLRDVGHGAGPVDVLDLRSRR